MARQTFVMRGGQLVPKAEAAPLQAGPFVISDNMDAAMHPCTGKLMDSKSAFRRVTRENGCVEVGNEKRTASPRADNSGDIRADIRRAIANPDPRRAADMGSFGFDKIGNGWQ